jgi:RNA polymerase sigma-70 factor (ECF subfamily)
MDQMADSSLAAPPGAADLETYRKELTGYCYRMLGSSFEAEDAVQETMLRAWRGLDRFEGRAALRSWLYRIATNVCVDMLNSRERRARPMDLGPSREPVIENLNTLPEVTWIEPIADSSVLPQGDPADVAVARETIKLAFVAALQHLPARQRARATLGASTIDANQPAAPLSEADRELLARYVDAFQRYDITALTTVIREDASQSMPPYDLWLDGRDDIFTWWFGPGIGCQGSRLVPVADANGSPAFGQYKPSPDGGFEPWALQVLELSGGRVRELTFFLDTERLFPLFGLPARLDA